MSGYGKQLDDLVTRRRQLVDMLTAERNRLAHPINIARLIALVRSPLMRDKLSNWIKKPSIDSLNDQDRCDQGRHCQHKHNQDLI